MKGHPAYNKMMVDVENFIESPGSEDVAVNSVFTDKMYDSLEKHMDVAGFKDLPKVREFWENDFKVRSDESWSEAPAKELWRLPI